MISKIRNTKYQILDTQARQAGFTLVELVVALSIVGIMMGLALVAFQSSRATARDAKRKADLETIRSALELYRADNDTYRVAGGGSSGQGYFNLAYPPNVSVAQALMTAGFLGSEPIDPIGTGLYRYMIYLCNSGQTYSLFATLETVPVNQPNITPACRPDIITSYSKNYIVTNP